MTQHPVSTACSDASGRHFFFKHMIFIVHNFLQYFIDFHAQTVADH